MKDKSDRNPFFLPALIATLIPLAIYGLYFAGDYLPSGLRSIIEPMDKLLMLLMFTGPMAATFFSGLGLTEARYLQRNFKGCLFCLIVSVLELPIFFGVSMYSYNHHTHTEPSIVDHSRSPEEIESIREEINRALYGDNTTRTTK